ILDCCCGGWGIRTYLQTYPLPPQDRCMHLHVPLPAHFSPSGAAVTQRGTTGSCRGWPHHATPDLHYGAWFSVTTESVDRGLVPGPQLRVADAQAVGRRQATHADLALVGVAMHLVRGLPGLRQRVGPGKRRVDAPARDEPVGLPRL